VIDSSGTTLFVVNQTASSISLFGIKTDGTLNTSTTQSVGSAPGAIALTK
jgi:6-phosphogluconolactonase (cycloisomerase 2 family)